MDVPRRLAVAACLLLTTGTALAATEAEKQAAIDNGLEWLAQTQNTTTGHWEYGPQENDTAATGAALLAFLEQGWRAGDDVVLNGSSYGDVVGRGLTHVLRQAQPYGIGVEPTGNPDSDGNQIGVKFVLGRDNPRDTYVTGLVVPAIARTGTPNALVTVGPLASRTDGSGPGGQWTYRDVVVNTTDYFAYGQADPGNSARGGWRYWADYGQADNSTAQWPPIAMLFSQSMGVSAPGFVKDELAHWINQVQNPISGGSGYTHTGDYVNVAKTGGLLAEMKFAGDDTGGTPYNLANSDVTAALGFIDGRWQSGPSGTWYGNLGHPYAMWSVYKGLEVMIGLDDTTYITNLRNQAALRGGAGAPLDPGDDWTWWEDYCEYIVGVQSGDGSWAGYSYWTGPLATAWYINILDATVVQEPVVPLPPAAPTALALLAGLALLRRMRRRRT